MNGQIEITGNGNKIYYAGLDWSNLYFDTKSQRRRKITDIFSDLKKPYASIIDAKGSSVCAVGLSDPKSKHTRRHHSLATCLSQQYPDSVHVQMIDGLFWVCWIEQSIPVNNGERFFKTNIEAKDFISEYVIPVSPDISFYGDRTIAPPVDSFVDIDLDVLLVSIKDKSSKILPRYTTLLKRITIATATAIFVLISSLTYINYANSVSAMKTKAVIERKAKRLSRQISKTRNLFFDSVATFGKLPSPINSVIGMENAIADLPSEYKGWTIKGIECVVDIKVCSIQWVSTNFGTNLEFREHFKRYRVDYDPNAKIILMEVDMSIERSDGNPGESIYDNLLSTPGFYNKQISKIQYLQASKVFQYVVDDKGNMLAAPSQTAASIKDKTLGITIREWKASGKGFYYIKDFAQYLPKTSFTIDAIVIAYETSNTKESVAKWTIRGRYAHKS